MTSIVGVVEAGQIYIGGDSAVSYGGTTQTLAHGKVFRHGNFLMGYSGSVRMLNLLMHAFTPPEHPEDMDVERYITTLFVNAVRTVLKDAGNATKQHEQENGTGYFLVGYRGKLFKIGYDYSSVEVSEGFDAIGSGNEVALGALHATRLMPLHAEKRIQLALEAAANYCQGVREPFTIEWVR